VAHDDTKAVAVALRGSIGNLTIGSLVGCVAGWLCGVYSTYRNNCCNGPTNCDVEICLVCGVLG